MAEDKYEQFKNWVAEKRIYITRIDREISCYGGKPFTPDFLKNLFEEFEEDNREKEIKKILNKYVTKIELDDHIINGHCVNDCYDDLKEGGYLK